MHIINIYLKIAINYWRRHKMRAFVAFISIAVGSCAIFCSGMLIRSKKQSELDSYLDVIGDYEAIIYDVTKEQREQILKLNGITEGGCYYNLGYAGGGRDDGVKIACFPDDRSCSLYHMSCVKGCYPERSGEIAIDMNTASLLGITPLPGESVNLDMYNLDGEFIASREFKISGVFDASNESVIGGWYRYPYNHYDYGEYKMPAIFINREDAGLFADKSDSTVFVVFNNNDPELLASLKELAGDSAVLEQNQGRSLAYSNILGIMDKLLDDNDGAIGGISIQNTIDAVFEGKVIKDFYSGVLMPIFNFLIAVMVFLSVYNVTKNVINDRREITGIIRSLGLSGSGSAWCLFAELMFFAVFSALIGSLLGVVLHIGIIELANGVYSQSLSYGFRVSGFVNEATNNPLISAVSVTAAAVILATIVPLIRFSSLSPAKLLNTSDNYLKKHSFKHRSLKRNWLHIINSRISFHDRSVMLMMVIVLSAALFGYLYFRALSDKANIEYRFELNESGLDTYDYSASKKDVGMGSFNVETHHDYGIEQQAVDQLDKSGFTKSLYAEIRVNSTNIVIPKRDVTEGICNLFEGRNLRNDYSDNDHQAEYREAQEAALRSSGYSSDEELFAVPCIGLMSDDLQDLNQYLVEGNIDLDEIRAGRSVILAVPENRINLCKSIFSIGNCIPMSAITTDDFEDTIDYRGNDQLLLPHVYDTELKLEDGSSVNMYSVHFGNRKDINTKVGALLALDDKALEKYGMLDNPGLYVFTAGKSAFESWGIRDSRYTTVRLKLVDGCNINAADSFWYESLRGSKGVEIRSAYSINNKIYGTYIKTMMVYFIIVILLVCCGVISICLALYTKTEINSHKIGILRMLGMSSRQITQMFVTQNLFYPVIAVITAIIPVALCQSLFNYIKRCIEDGTYEAILDIDDGGEIPWYHNIPFRYDLFSYNFPAVITVLIILGIMMILISTIPQLIHIRRHKMIRE